MGDVGITEAWRERWRGGGSKGHGRSGRGTEPGGREG